VTLDTKEKKSLSEIRMEKAREFFQDAADNYGRGRFRTSVNRAYYAVLNAARSLLIIEGLNPETHDGIITMMSLHFIKKDLLPVEIVKSYKILLARRTDVDYGDFDAITGDEAEHSVALARTTIDTIDVLRRRLIDEM
jgi:uncharacterized protein (UPF0332 family)